MLLTALERGDVSRWPGGIYRRSFIRAYAEAIGLDADEIAREFFENFPGPHAGESSSDAEPGAVPVSVPAPTGSGLRLTIEKTPDVCRPGAVLGAWPSRVGAALSDLAVLLTIAGGAALAFDAFWPSLAVATIAYYIGGTLVFGNTPGVVLFAVIVSNRDKGLNVRRSVPLSSSR
jgi:hypothetical protein